MENCRPAHQERAERELNVQDTSHLVALHESLSRTRLRLRGKGNMHFARVLERDRFGRPILWRCSECGKPFDLGWGSMCNACIEVERRHQELVAAIRESGGTQ